MGELSDYLVQNDPNFRKARLPALYSDFRSQKTLNPDGYQANVSAWLLALARLASDGLLSRQGSKSSALVFDLDESLRRSLDSKQFGQPLALGTVINEALAQKDLIPLQSFLQSNQSIYQQSWSQVPWNVMGWALRQLGVTDPSRGEDKIPKGNYVVMKNVETASRELGERIAEKAPRYDRVFTKGQFQALVTSVLAEEQRLSDTDTDVLLKFLSRDKDMIEYDGKTIRIRGSGEERGITEEDSSIASIKELASNLEHQIDLLNGRIDELDQEARNAVLRKNRVAALAALKSKKRAESSLSTRYATLHQLEEVASKLQQASDQVQLVKVMESSANALESLNTQIGSADKVENTMDRLRDQMSATDEITAILAEPTGMVVDEEEIDEELEAMEREQNKEEEEKQRRKDEAKEASKAMKDLDELPSVPSERIGAESPTRATGIGRLTLDG
ncbi:snf7 domain-containing protein [Trichoderma breve]|uniref:Snf7 domain-containing protein n=1 Tax=Trichoderma breve TaxID=2034170 RepID=A0A9W9B7P7_9HYPO|nr:snf7 domain-containing protein [Trichoderma breve]KAJ4857489.1 snf7 domain-containing protein [Trichoderma breve]